MLSEAVFPGRPEPRPQPKRSRTWRRRCGSGLWTSWPRGNPPPRPRRSRNWPGGPARGPTPRGSPSTRTAPTTTRRTAAAAERRARSELAGLSRQTLHEEARALSAHLPSSQQRTHRRRAPRLAPGEPAGLPCCRAPSRPEYLSRRGPRPAGRAPGRAAFETKVRL